MTRAGLYVRVSTEKQEAENQMLALRQFAAQRGWPIAGEYVDVISGAKNKRPGYDMMFRDVHQGRLDVVVFWDLSRFSRAGTEYTLQKLRELELAGVDWVSFQEPYISSAGQFRDVVISILASVAQIEREKISQRTKAGLVRARQNGAKLGRKLLHLDFTRIWSEYERGGSINRAAKLLPYSYGTVHFVISRGIRSQAQYEREKREDAE